jgi:DegV family protein with EDD domain
LDGIDLSPEDFYVKLSEAEELPTTSQPSPFDFEQVYVKARENGDTVIAICLAASLSGTYQSACVAKESCVDNGIAACGDIRMIDSGTATLGLQLLVRHAVRLRDEGKTADEIVNTIEAEKKRICLFAAIDTLEYLLKGGRLSKTAAFAGTLLKLKPLISFIQSEMKIAGRCRGTKKAHAEIFQLIESVGGIDYAMPFGIGYTGDRTRFAQFQQLCGQHFEGNVPLVSSIGSVIGTHAGPGAVAVVFFKNK